MTKISAAKLKTILKEDLPEIVAEIYSIGGEMRFDLKLAKDGEAVQEIGRSLENLYEALLDKYHDQIMED